MDLPEAIIQALHQCQFIYLEQGDWTPEQYMDMVLPLHDALNKLANTTEGATQIGAQRVTPSSPAKIAAEGKQTQRTLDAAGEQRDDRQVEAVDKTGESLDK